MESILSCYCADGRCRERGSIQTREVDRWRRWRKVLALRPPSEEATLASRQTLLACKHTRTQLAR